jgi:hypothetical protein
MAFRVLSAVLAAALCAGCAAKAVPPPPPPTTAAPGAAVRIGFDALPTGTAPAGFRCAAPGPAQARPARWEVQAMADAPSPPQVLVQADGDDVNHRYPVALLDAPLAADVRVAVKAKAISGVRDRSFGVVARAQDERNYYVARANTSEWGGNVRFYRFVAGERKELGEWGGDIAAGVWHDLVLEAVGDTFTVQLDGRTVLRVRDGTFPGPGRAGVWTKAEAVAAFDDLVVTPLERRP